MIPGYYRWRYRPRTMSARLYYIGASGRPLTWCRDSVSGEWGQAAYDRIEMQDNLKCGRVYRISRCEVLSLKAPEVTL